MRKVLGIILALILLLAAAGCAEQKEPTSVDEPKEVEQAKETKEEPPKETTEEETDDRILRILTNVVGGKDPEEHELFVKELEKRLGVKVEMLKPASDYDDVLLQNLGSGEKFDIVYTTSKNLPLLVDQGALTDMTDIIANSKVMSDPTVIPKSEFALYEMEGKLYGVPTKYEGGRLAIVRQDWLDEFGIAEPKTLGDWENYWKLCKEQKDAFGLATAGLYDIQPWASAWGLKDGMVVTDGKVSVPYATDEAAPMWDWFNKMYDIGYYESNFETNGTGECRNLIFGDRNGTMAYWDAWVGLFNSTEQERHDKGEFVMKGIKGVAASDGSYLLTRGDSALWAIPANSENVDLAIKFLEFWHSESGYLLGTLGIEGHDYTVENGEYKLTDIGKEHNLDHGSPRVTSTTWKNPFGALPGVEDAQAIISEVATPMYQPLEWSDAKKIVEYWGFKAIKGEVTGAEAVAEMQKELTDAGLIG